MNSAPENTLDWMFERQKRFSRNFYDVDSLTLEQKEKMTVQLSAALHTEVSSLLNGLNFQTHRDLKQTVNVDNIKYESVDVWRYIQAIVNLWGISPREFEDAYRKRDLFLDMRHDLEKVSWTGQPAILVDLDDVVTKFKPDFYAWLKVRTGVDVPVDSEIYYPFEELKSAGYENPDALFHEAISDNLLERLSSHDDTLEVVNELYDRGYWIHVVTARPDEVLTCKYDTFAWLKRVGLKCHRVSFENEKFLWASRTEYFRDGKLACAIDDSSKHIVEYSSHMVPTFAPVMSHNRKVIGASNVTFYQDPREMRDIIISRFPTSKK